MTKHLNNHHALPQQPGNPRTAPKLPTFAKLLPLLALGIFAQLILAPTKAYAKVETGSGIKPSGTGACDYTQPYHDVCYGFTWRYMTSSDVNNHSYYHWSGTSVYFEGRSNWSAFNYGNTKYWIADGADCTADGGFYVFGYERHDGNSSLGWNVGIINYDSTLNQPSVSYNKWGTYTSASDVYKALEYMSKQSGQWDEMRQKWNNGEIGSFCSVPVDEIPTAKLQMRSSVEANNLYSRSQFGTTGKSNTSSVTTVVNSGDTIDITFTHEEQLVSDGSVNENVSRHTQLSFGENTDTSLIKINGSTWSSYYAQKKHYSTGSTSITSANTSYTAKTNTYSVTFESDQKKTVEICEWNQYNGTQGYGNYPGYDVWSQSCAKIIILPKPKNNYNLTASVSIYGSVPNTDGDIYSGESFSISDITVTADRRLNGSRLYYESESKHTNFYINIDRDLTVNLTLFNIEDLSSLPTSGAITDDVSAYLRNYGAKNVVNKYRSVSEKFTSSDYYTAVKKTGLQSLYGSDTLYAYDLPAGSYFCAVVTVESPVRNDYQAMYGSYVSAPSCRKIYKKPSAQIWGGSVYTNGAIKTLAARKGRLNYSSVSDLTTFGSWTEYAIVSNGTVAGLASGSATAYTTPYTSGASTTNNYTISSGTTSTFCAAQTLLTIANENCDNTIGIKTSASVHPDNPTSTLRSTYPTANLTDLPGSSINYLTGTYRHEGDLTLDAATLGSGTIYLYVDGNLTISGNLLDANDSGSRRYTSSDSLSQAVIYATGNITIAPSVTRIDAWLLSDATISTGSSANQLYINGALTARYLNLQRYYGADLGVASGAPAEIINYSSTMLLWALQHTFGFDDEYYTSTLYLKEVAPRA